MVSAQIPWNFICYQSYTFLTDFNILTNKFVTGIPVFFLFVKFFLTLFGISLFPFFRRGVKPFIVHNNFVVGSYAKAFRFKEYLLWFVEQRQYFEGKFLTFDINEGSSQAEEFESMVLIFFPFFAKTC